jgi:HAD superfamily hydrolase (TIGR01509 family)
VKAVLFDLGNTLVSYYAAPDFAPILRRALDGCMAALGGIIPVEDSELFQRALTLNVERADLAVWPLAKRLHTLFGDVAFDPVTQERLTQAFLAPIFETAKLDPNALAALAELRAAGFHTAIVSNTPWGSPAAPWRTELERHNLLAAVDAAVFCVDVGFRKPHRAPFEQALSRLGLGAAEAFFVGDDPRWDVAGAEQAGLQPILLAAKRPKGVADTVPIATSLAEVVRLVRG